MRPTLCNVEICLTFQSRSNSQSPSSIFCPSLTRQPSRYSQAPIPAVRCRHLPCFLEDCAWSPVRLDNRSSGADKAPSSLVASPFCCRTQFFFYLNCSACRMVSLDCFVFAGYQATFQPSDAPFSRGAQNALRAIQQSILLFKSSGNLTREQRPML